jgi:hypothetical protein
MTEHGVQLRYQRFMLKSFFLDKYPHADGYAMTNFLARIHTQTLTDIESCIGLLP